MKYYEIWYNCRRDVWEIYEVTECGTCYRLYKTRKTKPTAWATKQWYQVKWR